MNFIPKNIWSYGDPGVSYCAIEQTTGCNDIENNYYFHNLALINDNISNVSSSRFLNNNQTNNYVENTHFNSPPSFEKNPQNISPDPNKS